MGLADYNRKRRFDKTTEPPAKKAETQGWSYVVQKHDASRLHYDFRLEFDGVLKSWAVPKGPSLDPAVKRLAIEVEDHPVAYGSFEGTIPKGEYGGGTVLLWDRGTWEPIGDPEEGLRSGKLKFNLDGEKLQGGWTLVRTRRSGSSPDKPQWLLIKERDEQAKSTDQGDILEEQPLSVASERDLPAIAADGGNPDHEEAATDEVLQKSKSTKPDRTASGSRPKSSRKSTKSKSANSPIPGPEKIQVQLATLVDKAPDGDSWCHEIKFDGYRMICHIDGGQVLFITRNHHDWTSRLPGLVEQMSRLKCDQAILDGEIVVMKEDGTTDFQSLQNAFREHRTDQLKYYLFDILFLNGQDLTGLPLHERKVALEKLLKTGKNHRSVQLSEPVVGNGDVFLKHACKLHLEGIISKRLDQPYRSGRGSDWLKVKCLQQEEFVLGGFTDPAGSRAGFGALLVGYYDEEEQLHYAGKVGTGFRSDQLKELHSRMKSLEQEKSPFVDLQRKVGDARTAHWIQPKLVGQIRFGGKTREMRLRHASFQGLREDKSPREVNQEEPAAIEEVLMKSDSKTPPAKKTLPQKTVKSEKTKTAEKPTSRKTAANKESSPQANSAEYDARSETFAGVRLTHPQKIVYPLHKITKLDVAEYYQAVAEWMLPHIIHRPIVLLRCPDGAAKECFYQKHPGPGTSDILRQIPIEESSATKNYVLVDNVDGLIALVQMGSLEIHTWGSSETQLERPDRLIFDLDPDDKVPWSKVIQSANQIREFLEELGLKSFVKTTGGKGLHLVVPIERRHTWPDAKEFCKSVAEAVVQADPSSYTSNLAKAARTNKIFIDYLRNARGATAVAAYSTRAKEAASVSMPLAWEELSAKLTSDHFTIKNALQRLTKLKQDPWQALSKTRQSLTGPIKKLKTLTN